MRHSVKKDRLLENLFDYSDITSNAKFEIMIDITCDYKLFKMQIYFKWKGNLNFPEKYIWTSSAIKYFLNDSLFHDKNG